MTIPTENRNILNLLISTEGFQTNVLMNMQISKPLCCVYTYKMFQSAYISGKSFVMLIKNDPVSASAKYEAWCLACLKFFHFVVIYL